MDDDCRRLIRELGHPNPRHQRAAEQQLEDKRYLPCLELALDDHDVPETTKTAISRMLYLSRWPEVGPIALRHLNSSNPEIRAESANTLAVLRYDAAGPALHKLLDEEMESTDVQGRAAIALGALHYQAAWESLVHHLHSTDETVRALSAKGLRFVAVPESIPDLEEAERNETSEWVRNEIIAALQAIRLSSQTDD